MLRFITLISLLFFCSFSNAETGLHQVSLLTYQQWKAEKITTALESVQKSNREQSMSLTIRNIKEKSNLQSRASQAQFQLEIAKDLTFNDYTVLYLAKHPQRSRAVEILSMKMSPKEVAELLGSHIRILNGERPEPSEAPTRVSDPVGLIQNQ